MNQLRHSLELARDGCLCVTIVNAGPETVSTQSVRFVAEGDDLPTLPNLEPIAARVGDGPTIIPTDTLSPGEQRIYRVPPHRMGDLRALVRAAALDSLFIEIGDPQGYRIPGRDIVRIVGRK